MNYLKGTHESEFPQDTNPGGTFGGNCWRVVSDPGSEFSLAVHLCTIGVVHEEGTWLIMFEGGVPSLDEQLYTGVVSLKVHVLLSSQFVVSCFIALSPFAVFVFPAFSSFSIRPRSSYTPYTSASTYKPTKMDANAPMSLIISIISAIMGNLLYICRDFFTQIRF
jgi:hypothetical protein